MYADIDLHEYSIPENKWKSEQLMFQLITQMFPKKPVYYQYRADFLKQGNSQLSYDVFIPSLSIVKRNIFLLCYRLFQCFINILNLLIFSAEKIALKSNNGATSKSSNSALKII